MALVGVAMAQMIFVQCCLKEFKIFHTFLRPLLTISVMLEEKNISDP
jgi:hypothetical protein